MAKVKWVGVQSLDAEYPEKPLPENAAEIKTPEKYLTASLPYAVLPALVSLPALFLKAWFIGKFPMSRPFIFAGIAAGLLLLTPVHEWLHAVCFPKGATAYIGITSGKPGAFAVCHFPISRRRFIVMSLAPAILGVVPLVMFMLFPSGWPTASAICWPAGMIGLMSPSPDYMDVVRVMKQVPKGAFIQSNNNGWFWF